ncbi:OprD family porin [Stutzerimonas tarimensis]|uniref:OprD family porin n=1 Tax=Stutzerimonas tarimensis TaxID=1507735 RepID=A0ABV7T8J2_9GAMM
MNQSRKSRLYSGTLCPLALVVGTSIVPMSASAAFIEDSKGSLVLRNFYINRDFRHDTATQSKAEEWAQGFMLNIESGYTEGPVGFGLDALGLLGIKLDSSAARSNSGTLPFNPVTREPVDDFSNFGLTGKMRFSDTTLHVGTLQPMMPLVFRNLTRLLPTTYRGALLRSQEIKGLDLTLMRLSNVSARDSSGYDDITIAGRPASTAGDHFDVAAVDYAWTDALKISYHYGELKDVYSQHYAAVSHVLPLTEKLSLDTNFRYFGASDAGQALAGEIDNQTWSVRFGLAYTGHKVTLGYQEQSGHSGMPFQAGTDPYTVTASTYQVFIRPEETSWQLRYDLNFAAYGVPGLTLMARHTVGSNIERGAGLEDDREWERNIDLGYVVQDGALKGFGVLLRNVMYRSHYATDVDENRVLLTYTMNLW